MKQLPEVFIHDGFEYKQVRRNEYAAIYRQHWLRSKTDRHDCYEVVIPQIGKKRRNPETQKWEPCDPYEHYPSSAQWGDDGWTLTTEDRANQKFEEVVQKAISDREQSRRNRRKGERV